jgi:hypothetical protein
MAKYNVVMRWKREKAQERKRALHGDPKTKKLKELSKHPSSLSGKRKQKLLRKYRRVSYQFSLSLSFRLLCPTAYPSRYLISLALLPRRIKRR